MVVRKGDPTRPRHKRKSKPHTIGRAVHIRKPKVKRQHSKMEDSAFFEDVEAVSDVDSKVRELIRERRAEAKKAKEGGE